jgi:ribosomal protein S17
MKNNGSKPSPVVGKVVGVSPEGRTAKVELLRVSRTAMYGKIVRRQTVVHVDVKPDSKVVIGQQVSVSPCKRVSKLKSWQVSVS